MTPPDPEQAWSDACLASAMLAICPSLGGIRLRARASPLRDLWLDRHKQICAKPVRRLPPGVEDERLLGGLDLAATLASGRPVQQAGLLAEVGRGTLILPMAERASAGMAGRIAAALDAGAGFTLVALDEGVEPDEQTPAALSERLAIHLAVDGPLRDVSGEYDLTTARKHLAKAMPADQVDVFVEAAAALGIASLRAPIFAHRAARAAAALAGRDRIAPEDAATAARLVLAPRATQMPADEDEETPQHPEPPPPGNTQPDNGETDAPSGEIPAEMLLEAVRASLPPDVLTRLAAAGSLGPGKGASAGNDVKGARRGRPAGITRGDPRGPQRLDLVATLRAAAPWQPIRRRRHEGDPGRVLVRQDDIRVRRYSQAKERLAIFVVDASGSTALARLAETKGAIELMLAEAYVRREQVALIAFRGEGADLLLPPTRSLVQTKRRLAALPGGGATPLAAGLEAALALADTSRRQGLSPALILLTDGKANIGRDGTSGREQARKDAGAMAEALRRSGLPAILIDTSPRPQTAAAALAEQMGATYLPLPRADAKGISRTVEAALSPGS